MRPTRKAGIVALLAVMLFISGSTAQAGWLFVLASLVLAALVFSLFARHRLARISVERTGPVRVQAGDEATVPIVVNNSGRITSPLIRMTDRTGAFPETSYLVEPMAAGSSVMLTPAVVASRRGIYTEGAVELATGAPFGLKRSKRIETTPVQITVVPRWVRLRSFPLLEPASFPQERLHERARVGSSDELFGTREYRRGDPFRSIHWKSSAHAGHLIVREYQQEVAGRVVIPIWADEACTAPDSDLEALVSSAASVGNYALHAGHRVELVFPTEDGPRVVPAMGLNSLLDGLAAVRASTGDLTELTDLVVLRAGKRGTVVLHTSTLAMSSHDVRAAIRRIEMAGNRVIAVVADSASWGTKADVADIQDARNAARAARVLTKDQDLRACLEGS